MARTPRADADPGTGTQEKVRPDELSPTEQVRQGTTGHGVRYVLTFGLIFVVVAFLLAWVIIRWLEFGGTNA